MVCNHRGRDELNMIKYTILTFVCVYFTFIQQHFTVNNEILVWVSFMELLKKPTLAHSNRKLKK